MLRAEGQILASVLVGSVNGGEPIHTLLDALERQTGDVPFEVIVVDRCEDGTAERISRERPCVRVLAAQRRTPLPELRTRALECARGQVILVTEDHTIPPAHWVERLVRALQKAPDRIAAAGGAVDNARRERAVDWAAFLCEYSRYLPPQPGGEVDDIPGMNIAYRRTVLDRMDRDALTRGFWESTVHPRLLDEGYRFLWVEGAVLQHAKRFGFFEFLLQRLHYSRHFGGVRFDRRVRARRFAYALLSLALPALILMRVARDVLRRPAYGSAFLRSLPALSCFATVWGLGEASGYLFGPGDSLAEIE